MLVDAPSAGVVGKIFEDEFNWLSEGVVTIVDGDQDAIFPKSDDVLVPVVSNVGDEADVFVNTPAPCVVTEVVDSIKGLDRAVTEDNNSVEAKADDIREAWAVGGN